MKHITATLGAHLAHMVFRLEPGARRGISPGEIFQRFLETLARGRGGLYLRKIVGAGTAQADGGPSDPDEASLAWFSAVMERPLALHGKRDFQTAHTVLGHLVAHGDPSARCALRRETTEPGPCGLPPPPYETTFELLGEFNRNVDRVRPDPLVLHIDGSGIVVPDTLSLWSAIRLAPTRLCPPACPQDADACVHAMIRAFETANERWDTLRSLGVWPPAWMDVVSINQARSARAFRIALGNEAGDREATREQLERAWSRRRVSGFTSLDAFMNSDLGHALFSGRRHDARDLDVPSSYGMTAGIEGENDSEIDLGDDTALKARIEALCASGRFTLPQQRLLRAVGSGARLEAIVTEPWARRAFGGASGIESALLALADDIAPSAD